MFTHPLFVFQTTIKKPSDHHGAVQKNSGRFPPACGNPRHNPPVTKEKPRRYEVKGRKVRGSKWKSLKKNLTKPTWTLQGLTP